MTNQADELVQQWTGRTMEALAVWAEAQQRALSELVELSAATSRDALKLYGELQQGAVEAYRTLPSTVSAWQSAWEAKDPAALYQHTVAGGLQSFEQAARLWDRYATVLTRSAERFGTSSQQTGKTVQEAFTTAVSRVKEVYAQR